MKNNNLLIIVTTDSHFGGGGCLLDKTIINIRKCKISPELSYQVFSNVLYNDMAAIVRFAVWLE